MSMTSLHVECIDYIGRASAQGRRAQNSKHEIWEKNSKVTLTERPFNQNLFKLCIGEGGVVLRVSASVLNKWYVKKQSSYETFLDWHWMDRGIIRYILLIPLTVRGDPRKSVKYKSKHIYTYSWLLWSTILRKNILKRHYRENMVFVLKMFWSCN